MSLTALADNFTSVGTDFPLISGYSVVNVYGLPGVTTDRNYPCRYYGRIGSKYLVIPFDRERVGVDNTRNVDFAELANKMFLVSPSGSGTWFNEYWTGSQFINDGEFSGLMQDTIEDKTGIVAKLTSEDEPYGNVMVGLGPSSIYEGENLMLVRVFGPKAKNPKNIYGIYLKPYYENSVAKIAITRVENFTLPSPMVYPTSLDYINLVNYGSTKDCAAWIGKFCMKNEREIQVNAIGNVYVDERNRTFQLDLIGTDAHIKTEKSKYYQIDLEILKSSIVYSQGSMVFTGSDGNIYYYLSGWNLEGDFLSLTYPIRSKTRVIGWKLVYDDKSKQLKLTSQTKLVNDRREGCSATFDSYIYKKSYPYVWEQFLRHPKPPTLYDWGCGLGITLCVELPKAEYMYYIDNNVQTISWPVIIPGDKIKYGAESTWIVDPAAFNNSGKIDQAQRKNERMDRAKNGNKIMAIIYGIPYWAYPEGETIYSPKISYTKYDQIMSSKTLGHGTYSSFSVGAVANFKYGFVNGSAELGYKGSWNNMFKNTQGWKSSQEMSPSWEWQDTKDARSMGFVYYYENGAISPKIYQVLGMSKVKDSEKDMIYTIEGLKDDNGKPMPLTFMVPMFKAGDNAQMKLTTSIFDINSPDYFYKPNKSDKKKYYSPLTDGIVSYPEDLDRWVFVNPNDTAKNAQYIMEKQRKSIKKWQTDNGIDTLIEKAKNPLSGIYRLGIGGSDGGFFALNTNSGMNGKLTTANFSSDENSRSWQNGLYGKLTVTGGLPCISGGIATTFEASWLGSELDVSSKENATTISILSNQPPKVLPMKYNSEVYVLYISIEQVKSDTKGIKPPWMPYYCWENNNNYIMIVPYLHEGGVFHMTKK